MQPKNNKLKDNDGKESRLQQMRQAQKRLKDKRKQEIEGLNHELYQLKQENIMIKEELNRYKNDFNSVYGLLDTGITKIQFKAMLSITKYKFEDENDAYIPLHTLLETFDYNKHRKLFDVDNNFLLKLLCSKVLKCVSEASDESLVRQSYSHNFKHLAIYGITLLGNWNRDNHKIYYENLVPKCWFYPKEKMILPNHSLSLVEIIDEIIKRFDPNAMILEVLLSFLSRYSFATDYGFAIYKEDIDKCFEISLTANFDEAYILGTVDEQICLSNYVTKVKVQVKHNFDQSE